MLYIGVGMNDVIATGHMMCCLPTVDVVAKCGKSTTIFLFGLYICAFKGNVL